MCSRLLQQYLLPKPVAVLQSLCTLFAARPIHVKALESNLALQTPLKVTRRVYGTDAEYVYCGLYEVRHFLLMLVQPELTYIWYWIACANSPPVAWIKSSPGLSPCLMCCVYLRNYF